MPVELLMTNRDGALVPVTRHDEDEMLRVPERRALTVRISRTAPSKMRAWYRTLLSRLVDATDAWPTPEEAHKGLLLRCGFFESLLVSDWGDLRFTPPSTREWDEIQWRAYLDRLWPIVVNDIVPEIGERRLRDGIKVLIGLDVADVFEEAKG